MKQLPLGIMDYRRLQNDNYYSVDKSMMISEFLNTKRQVTLVTRPRRFGKTLNMSMMAEFFDITKDSKEIFEDTNIMKTEYACELNQWPTIFISFAGAKGEKSKAIRYIKMVLRNEFERYNYIFTNMNESQTNDYNHFKKEFTNLYEGNLNDIDMSLAFLMEMLEKYYEKPVMLFIDEYDTPFIEAHVNRYYDDVKDGLSSILHNSLKLSNNLKYAFVTGIQRVAKENIFSDLNNIVVCTVNDEEYSNFFGFTEEETRELLQYYDLELNPDVKKMYDGYHFGSHDIYNPWSIINYAQRKKLESYWVYTSSNAMIRHAMENSDQSFKDEYELLVKNGYLDTLVSMETSFYEQSKTENLWGLFINAGYLTISKRLDGDFCQVIIPNQEVQKEFKMLTADYLDIESSDLERICYALKVADKDKFIQTYQYFLTKYPSYFDLISENSYHMIWICLGAGLNGTYEIKSNKEEGKGRCDLILKSKNPIQPSYVIEFKYSKEECDLDKLANAAIQQIIDKEYDIGLNGKIIYIGLAHHGKNVAVKWMNKEEL